MIVLANAKPTFQEFSELMCNIDKALNHRASIDPKYFLSRNGVELEADVLLAANECAKGTKFEGFIQLVSGTSFPDIVASKYYGIEVKSSKSDNWKTIGNSILETTRVSDVERIYLTFGKLSTPVEFKSRPYEECLSGVAVTHYPRYQIDMSLKEGDTIFDKIGISYDSLRALDNPIAPVAKYYKSKLRKGQSLWWAGDNVDVASPITVKLWKSLHREEQKILQSTLYAYFPETIISNSRHQYDRATLWLATQNSVIHSNIRDSFSAGGQKSMSTVDGRMVTMPAIFKRIDECAHLIRNVISETSSEVLSNYWGNEISEDRVAQWIDLVVSYASNAEERRCAKSVLENIFG